LPPSVSIDCVQLPIVVLTFTGIPRLDDLEVSLWGFDDLLRQRVRYVLVIDASEMGIVPSALRQRSARWLIENAVDVVHCCLGVVCVATHPFARAALTAMEWLDPRGAKYIVVDTLDEAMGRARKHLEDSGLGVSGA